MLRRGASTARSGGRYGRCDPRQDQSGRSRTPRDDHDEARRLLTEGIQRSIASGVGWGNLATALVLLTTGEALAGRHENATITLAAVTREIELSREAMAGQHQERLDDVVATLRESLDDRQFASLWVEGQGLGLEEAAAYAVSST